LRKCSFYVYLASTVRWPSGRRRRFAKPNRISSGCDKTGQNSRFPIDIIQFQFCPVSPGCVVRRHDHCTIYCTGPEERLHDKPVELLGTPCRWRSDIPTTLRELSSRRPMPHIVPKELKGRGQPADNHRNEDYVPPSNALTVGSGACPTQRGSDHRYGFDVPCSTACGWLGAAPAPRGRYSLE
jgi:hypothetical protein